MTRLDARRIDIADPQSWLKGADGRLILDEGDVDALACNPAIDKVPARPFTRPGRTLQMIGMRTWLRAIGTTMTLTLASCLFAGFHLLPGEFPLYPMSAQLSVFGAMVVVGSRNAFRLSGDTKGMRAVLRILEACGWATVLAGPVLIGLIATGVLRTS